MSSINRPNIPRIGPGSFRGPRGPLIITAAIVVVALIGLISLSGFLR
ncbi:MAG: hypothetical protein WDO06_00275 [Actinomycetota bacterium]